MHSSLVSFTALLPCPSAALDGLRFHPREEYWGLGAQWLSTGSEVLSSNSTHLQNDTNSAINVFKPRFFVYDIQNEDDNKNMYVVRLMLKRKMKGLEQATQDSV